MKQIQEAARRSGEPMKASFDPHSLSAHLASQGLRLQKNLSPSEIEKR
ncbi:MAG: hypothetical protein P4L49_09885 [Desulfosporosinus sp.]|nr:hypothetical protein [Desulfosporosinus sp.]